MSSGTAQRTSKARQVRRSVHVVGASDTFSKGTIIASRTEREIFDILGVPWQEPPARRRLR